MNHVSATPGGETQEVSPLIHTPTSVHLPLLLALDVEL